MTITGAADGHGLEYWVPDAALAGYVSGYHRYRLTVPDGLRHHDVFFPAWTNLRFSGGADPWSVRLGGKTFRPVPEAALFGPTSRAGYVDCGNGTLSGIGLTPRGWARLFGAPLDDLADRILPARTAIGAEIDVLAAALADGAPPPALFDDWLRARLERLPPEPEAVGIIFAALADPAVGAVSDLVARTGLNERALVRRTRRWFGFPPKLLLRRARFLRALTAIATLPRGRWSEEVRKAGYWDQAHFVRDCHGFLDMAPGAFLRLPKPIAEASLRLRAQVLGAPVQALHGTAA